MQENETILPGPEEEWQSSGLLKKPPGCKFCSMSKLGINFVPDFIPEKAKILFVFSAPEKDDILENRPLSGNLGWMRRNKLIDNLGLKQYDVAVTNIIRCYPGKDKFFKLAYPSAAVRVGCEKLCRQYDNRSMVAGQIVPQGVINFDPNVFVVTFGVEMLSAGAAFQHLMVADIKKGLNTLTSGGRPAILFGEAATNLFASYCFGAGQGGLKTWRGHIFESSWKDLAVKDADIKEISAMPNPFRRTYKKPVNKITGGVGFSVGAKPAYAQFRKKEIES